MCIIVFAGKKFASVQSAIKPFAKEATYTPMAGNILFLIRRLNLALEQRSRAQAAGQFGLTTTQALVLDCLLHLEEGQSLCATDLHRRLGTSKAALSAALKGLGEGGYLQITSCPGDDRKKQIAPTPKARGLHRQIEQIMAGLERQLCTGLAGAQVDAAEYALWKMLQNISRPAAANQSTSGRETV